MLKKILIIGTVLIICGGLLGGLYYWNQVSWPVSDDTTQQLFAIHDGDGVKVIGANLQTAGLIRSTFWFETYVYVDGSETQFIAGTYALQPNMNIREIVHALTSGDTKTPSITILEGRTVSDIGEYLEGQGIVGKTDFVSAASVTDTRTIIPDKTYAFLEDKPADQGLEGFLFPDTYEIFDDATSNEIIEKMLDTFNGKFTDEMYAAAASRGMTVYQIVTLASIIEKEANIPRDESGQATGDEHYRIASVFYNRLGAGIPLQSDATVNYVTNGGRRQPTADDLAVDSPYNTYMYKGLPPGPINNPSLEAIKAALYPAETDYLYFLHKQVEDGAGAVFSRTYDEHIANKQQYLQ